LPQINPFSFGDDEMNLDDAASVICSVTKGDLPIKIWWTLVDDFNDGVEKNLSTNDGLMITRSGQKLSLLNIESVKARHRGNYTCYAKNKAGITQHSAFLFINGLQFIDIQVIS
jgi:Immunoglobulin domain